MSDLIPDTDEVLQEEPAHAPLTPIPVVVDGPVRVSELPGMGLVMNQMDVDNVTAIKLFGDDPRRKRLTLFSSGGAIRVATSQRMCTPGSGAIIPVGAPGITITSRDEIWVMAASGSATTVSYVAEQWAAG